MDNSINQGMYLGFLIISAIMFNVFINFKIDNVILNIFGIFLSAITIIATSIAVCLLKDD
jgi:hypothetical protein